MKYSEAICVTAYLPVKHRLACAERCAHLNTDPATFHHLTAISGHAWLYLHPRAIEYSYFFGILSSRWLASFLRASLYLSHPASAG